MRTKFILPLGLALAGLVGCGPKRAPNTIQ